MRMLNTLAHKLPAVTYLRLSVIDGCDMRCTYCRPSRTTHSNAAKILSADDIVSVVNAFASIGINKVRITGGEPLQRRDIVEIAARVAKTPGISTIGLTTNGVALAELAPQLVQAGLQRINISLDSLDSETFRRITGRDCLDNVLSGLETALSSGFDKVKLNTVVMRGINDAELPAIADLARLFPIEARFIELMPLGFSTDHWRSRYVSAAEIREILGNPEPSSSDTGSSARLYSFSGWKGRIGIISPMSEHFCAECNRIRITASGVLKPCLRLPVEEDIKPLINEPDLAERLRELLGRIACCKLKEVTPGTAVQADAMSAVGG